MLAISVDESNEEFFKKLECSLSGLASAALPCTKCEDFKLIKESKNYHNIYCKIYTYPSGKHKCCYSELIDGKCRVKLFEDAAFEKFKGNCVVRITHAFSGKTKGITICIDEILNYSSKKSCFDEFPERLKCLILLPEFLSFITTHLNCNQRTQSTREPSTHNL